jgi:hypothetical protein
MPYTITTPKDFIHITDTLTSLIVRHSDILHVTSHSTNEFRVYFRTDTDADGYDYCEFDPANMDIPALLATLNGDTPTTPPPNALRELVITRITRGETRNSGSPMWRCYDEDGEQVNVFKHADPDKNNWRIVEAAGWGPAFERMSIDGELIFAPHSGIAPRLRMIVKHDGKYNNLVAIPPRPPVRIPSEDDGPPPPDPDDLTPPPAT